MDYEGVNADTIDNGRALNTAFIQFILASAGADATDDPLRKRLLTLDPGERSRLASVPFLLYTLEPLEPGAWRPGIATDDLFSPGEGGAEWRLVTATLALLWSLARANRYAARFLYGVPVARCDAIAALPLMGVIDAARRSATGVVQRLPRNDAFWRKLFVSATDSRARVRRAARQSALQCVLTVADSTEPLPLATAACRRRTAARAITAVSEPDRDRRS